mmetsp:Transcript_18991/g.43117  ORF Transcript_18991/g.43117 Transcript_18991/m.43117 type:complete len:226 (+) Transcript_18991:150-827(+)
MHLAQQSPFTSDSLGLCNDILLQFRRTLHRELDEALAHSTADTAQTLQSIYIAAEDLMDRAVFVFMNHVLTAMQMKGGLLESLEVAMSKAKRHALASLMGAAQSSLGELRLQLVELKDGFVMLLGRLSSLASLAQTTSNQCVVRDHGAACCRLKCCVKTLNDCSDFWELLQDTEVSLAVLEASARSVRSELLSARRIPGLPPQCKPFLSGLRSMCTQCCLACQAH